ncbi:MAG: GtrA family protein [Betaproteobacteria bacterium]|jgi:putative flippase GtrA
MPRQFLAFVATGGIAAIVNFFSRIAYNEWTTFAAAVVLAYLTGMVTAFILARLFVFPETDVSFRSSAFRFCIINGLAILQTWVISMLLAYLVLPAMGVSRYAPEIAHAAGVIFPVFTSYLGHKYWTFRTRL